jgi:hypothetical protein
MAVTREAVFSEGKVGMIHLAKYSIAALAAARLD